MKSEHIKSNNTVTKLKFPLLAEYVKSSEGKFVVMFTDYSKGTIVASSHTYRKVGECDSTFIPIDNKGCWRILDKDEKIVLSNS